MDPRSNYRYSTLNNESAKFLTYILIIANIVFAILGSVMFATGLYALLQERFYLFVTRLEMNQYYIGIYILLTAGAFTMLQTFFGILGAYQKKSVLLAIFSISMFVCIVLELIGASFMLNNGVSLSQAEIWLDNRFMELIANIDFDLQAKSTLNTIQEWVGCCGSQGIADYLRWNKVVPDTCYDQVNGNAWYQRGYGYVGCVRGFMWYIEPITGWISAMALILAFLQIFTLIAAVMLACIKRDFKSRSMNNLAG